MPFPCPPPPPGPPAPIFGNGATHTANAAGDGRGLLMHSIRQGTALKKTVTNDRSSPMIGKVSNVSYSNNNNNSSSSSRPRNNNNNHAGASDMSRNGLGGLFVGGVPKLKPAGRGYSTNSSSQTLPRSYGLEAKANLSSSQNGLRRKVHIPSPSSGHEHGQHWGTSKRHSTTLNRLGFKFNEATVQQSQDPVHRPSLGDVKNRGPPPQPPPSAQKPMPTSASDSVLTGSGSLSGQSGSNSSFSNHNHVNYRSFLHGGSPPSLPSKPPVGGYGKPNLAPKPPGIAPNISSKPSPPPKKQVVNGTFQNTDRPPVTRAHSMRVPRSPPVAPPQGLPFPPTTKDLGSYRGGNSGLPSFHQSQDSIHHCRANPPPPPRTATLPSNLSHHGTKSAAPQPPPPSTPPPSTPYSGSSRSGVAPSVKAPVARPPPPPLRILGGGVNPPQCPPPPPPTSAPPPPPHRTSPAPLPPSLQTKLAPAVPNSAPPPLPVRNASMRACIEIESRFSEYFHSVHEFPTPQTFEGVYKVFNSRTVNQMVTSAAKQQAPQPPMVVQLGNKMYSSNASNC